MSAVPKKKQTLRQRLQQRRKNQGYQRIQPNLAELSDEPYWSILPDILQAQVIVQVNAVEESIVWAGAPHLRKSSLAKLFLIWSILLIIPVVVCTELVDDVGGWIAIGWAFISVFIFVPRISQSSRVAFCLTTKRAFRSTRTLFCSIETEAITYSDVVDLNIDYHDDGTGDVYFYQDDMFNRNPVTFHNVKAIRDVERCLDILVGEQADTSAGLGPEEEVPLTSGHQYSEDDDSDEDEDFKAGSSSNVAE